MKLKRIKPPKFKVGRYTLNEYELRQLMLDVALGEVDCGIEIKDEKGNTAVITESGFLEFTKGYLLKRFSLSSDLTMKLIRTKIRHTKKSFIKDLYLKNKNISDTEKEEAWKAYFKLNRERILKSQILWVS